MHGLFDIYFSTGDEKEQGRHIVHCSKAEVEELAWWPPYWGNSRSPSIDICNHVMNHLGIPLMVEDIFV